jgi:uncharacterized membrane protein
MVGVLLLLEPIANNLILLFFLGALLCTVIELVGGWVLERVFQTRWWDYSDRPLNLGGYVCLGFSILWGLAVIFVVRLIHPIVYSLVSWIPHTLGVVLVCVLFALFLVDFGLTLGTIIGLKKRLVELDRVAEALHTVGDNLSDRLGASAIAADAKLDEMKLVGQEKLAENKEKMETAVEAQQKKWDQGRERLETRVTDTLQELQDRKAQLEARQGELLGHLRNHPRFGTRRLYSAFPNMKQALKEHLDHVDQ